MATWPHQNQKVNLTVNTKSNSIGLTISSPLYKGDAPIPDMFEVMDLFCSNQRIKLKFFLQVIN